MATVSVSTTIAAPVERVFALSTDLDNWAGHIKAIKKVEKLTPGPVGVGTRFRETRVMFGREATEEMTFTAFEPNRRYVLEANSCGAHFVSTFCFEPDGSGTRVEVTCEARPVSLMAKLMSPFAFLMKGMLKKSLVGDMNDLKASAEGGGRAA